MKKYLSVDTFVTENVSRALFQVPSIPFFSPRMTKSLEWSFGLIG